MRNEALTRIPFWSLFSLHADGSLQLAHNLIVNGARFGSGSVVRSGELMAGVDMHKRRGQDLAIAMSTDGAYILRGFYLPSGQQ